MGPLENLTAVDVKKYIRWIANRRLTQLGLEPIYKVEKNPLEWLDTILNAVEHMNFFEGRSTEYSKAATQGTWVEAFEDLNLLILICLRKIRLLENQNFLNQIEI
jgi:ribonucleoside-diphosphate reductase beta chain